MPKRSRKLSEDEKKLWSSVAATATPLAKPSEFTPTEPPAKKRKPTPQAPKRQPIPEFSIGQLTRKTPGSNVDLAKSVTDRVAAAPVNMDKNTFRKLNRGRLKPEARIDLHGMTLAQAQPALSRFISSSFADGKRLVLVITGKGRSGQDSGGPIPERRGVLRDQVPRWLKMAPNNGIVMQVVNAHATHGGTGAYYVYLRRLRK